MYIVFNHNIRGRKGFSLLSPTSSDMYSNKLFSCLTSEINTIS